jgi:regulator of protease activity HflC (stomatin/prohibitin superfamily)
MKNFWTLIVIGSVLGVALIAGSCIAITKYERIHPGYVGVSVKKCSGGGVTPTPIQPGIYWREMFCEEVVEYPVSMQSLILTKNPHEGTGGPDNETDQSIIVNSSEGLGIETDVAMNFTLEAAKVPSIYEKWRADIESISHKYIRQTIREGLQNTFSKYTAEELYSVKKEIARAEVEKFLRDKLAPMGFVISQFTINRIQPPTAVINAINAKVAMVQDAQRSEQEVRKKQAEANQAVAVSEGKAKAMRAEAEGEAQAITLRAEAQAKANEILAKSVTPELVEYEKMRRWNGVLPQFTGNVVPMVQLK